MEYLIQGLILGFSYVAPIGTQNLYVINTALKKSRFKALQTALITTSFDISLAVSCFYGIGFLIDKFFALKLVILFLGSIMVIYIGIKLVKASPEVSVNENAAESTLKTISTCFVVTWLNPQAIIDGSLLLGGFKVSLPADKSIYFILGVCLASLMWFTTLTVVVFILHNNFSCKLIRILNTICGIIIIVYGFRLGFSFLTLIT
jgi:L-lysine exporter family protein LysE/ArgO